MSRRRSRNNVFLNDLKTQHKNWKFSATDLSERSKWADYTDAYEEMVNETSTEWAPWYIIPSDKKWVTHALISEILVSQIKKLDLRYPTLSKEQKEALETAKAELEKE